jgi:hypothetical protein
MTNQSELIENIIVHDQFKHVFLFTFPRYICYQNGYNLRMDDRYSPQSINGLFLCIFKEIQIFVQFLQFFFDNWFLGQS